MDQSRQIVVVEDVFVRSFLRTALERMGHRVICATPVEAVRVLRTGEIDLLVTNCPASFAEFGAAIPLVYVAAFPDPAAAESFTRWLPLRKPFQTVELRGAVDRLLSQETSAPPAGG